jgi:hypothetical protein
MDERPKERFRTYNAGLRGIAAEIIHPPTGEFPCAPWEQPYGPYSVLCALCRLSDGANRAQRDPGSHCRALVPIG